MTKARFGIVGCGGAALSVSEALAESSSAQLGKVYDLDLNLARDMGSRYQVPYAENLDELLADPAIDGDPAIDLTEQDQQDIIAFMKLLR